MSVSVGCLIDIKVCVVLTLMTKFPLGALHNGEYCLPCNAEKGLDYICPGCKAPVILRRGEIKAPHFAHKPSERRCEFYDHPGEGEIHKMVKHIIADLLRKKKIKKVVRSCPKGCTYDEEIDYEEGDEVIDEYPIGDRYKVDVALINNGKIKYIFEVYNTHKTTRETPEPWFEIDAKKFLKDTENGTKLTKGVEYSLNVGEMTLLQVVEELHERGVDLGGTLYEKCNRLENERRKSECVYCIRVGKYCPSCKIHMADFTATSYRTNGYDKRTECMKQAIINSKEYEQCYLELGAIKSICDYKGELSVYMIDAYKYMHSTEFIQRKFKDMLLREWSELDWGPQIAICDATDKYIFHSEWGDEKTNTRVVLHRPGVRKYEIEDMADVFKYQCVISSN
jgi:hypothetical protein